MPLRPLLLTGPPAVGKSSLARALAKQRPPCALIEVDDLRQLVVAGAVPAWETGEGARQAHLAALHACHLMASFSSAGFTVVTTDVLLWDTGAVYRSPVARPFIVHLRTTLEEARRRAASRQVSLTEEEFRHLHETERGAEFSHVDIDATRLSLHQVEVIVTDLWQREGG